MTTTADRATPTWTTRARRVAALATLATALATVPATPTAAASPPEASGALDPTFSGDGRIVADLGAGEEWGSGVAVQDNGAIVVTGTAGTRVFVARYLAGGAPDPTFSGDGRAFVDLSTGREWLNDLAVQDDGAIVAAGASHGGQRTAVVRFTPTGVLDSTFSGDGRLTTDFAPGGEFAYGIALAADGDILMSGQAIGRMAVMSVEPDGTIDTAFSHDGWAALDVGNGPDVGFDLEERGDGRILVTGNTGVEDSERTAVARFHPDGSLDGSFGSGARVVLNSSPGYEDATSIRLLDDDRILIAGDANGRVFLARFLPDGGFDPTFSGDGKVVTDLPGYYEFASVVRLQPDGKAVISGYVSGGSGGRMLVARYRTNGTLDPTFSGNGWNGVDLTTGPDQAWDLALQADGRMLLTGSANEPSRVGVTRVLAA